MKKPLSIIIPTLNEEYYLPLLLSDLSKQSKSNFEVIVVDGFSEDETVKKAKDFENELDISVFSVKKRNISYQRNYAVKKTKGEYLIFLDADSRVRRSFTKNIEKEVTRYKNLIFLPKIMPQNGTKTDEVLFELLNFFIQVTQNVGKPLPSIGSMIFQKDFFLFIGGYNEARSGGSNNFFPEDHEIILRARKYGVLARQIKSVTVGFSLRRMEREGKVNVIKKHLISTVQMSLKGDIERKIFEYEMGGHLYKKLSPKAKTSKYMKDLRKLDFKN